MSRMAKGSVTIANTSATLSSTPAAVPGGIQRQPDGRRRPSRFYGMATLAIKRSSWCNAPSGFWPLLLELSDQAG